MSIPPLQAAKLPSRKPLRPPPLPGAAPSLLNLEEADRFKDLLLFAKAQVEGYFSGKHKSPHFGSDVEFAEHKEYVSGQDISNIDWRVYGRTKRLFVRQYKEETDMVAYLLVDTSASMQYKGRGLETKLQHALKITAVLSYLMMRQGDKASLTLFSDRVLKFLPPSGTRRHLHNLLGELEAARPTARTDIAAAARECGSLFKKRGCLIILSDFLGDTRELFDALGQFLHRRYDVLLLQIIDPDELDLPNIDIAQFIDMETGEQVEVEPDEIRRAYRENMEALIAKLSERANRRHLRHALIDTRHPYLQAIEAWLGFRGVVRQ
jgi:uncharacterized protein (DUF58 family)